MAIHDQVNPSSLTNLPFGSVQRIREPRLNRKPLTIRIRINKNQHTNPKRKAEIRNLRQIPTIDKSNHEIVQTIRVSTVNARSLKYKENLISKEIHNTNSDITIITKTWLKTPRKTTPGHFHQNLTMTYIKYQQNIGQTKGDEE